MPETITFLPATVDDFEYFYATRKDGMMPHMAKLGRVWDEDYERKYNKERFNTQLPYLRIILVNGNRVGFICVRPDENKDVYLESFCIERRHQAHDQLSSKVVSLIFEEPQFQDARFISEIMKGYPMGQLAKKAGFRLIDATDEFDIYERPAAKAKPFPSPLV
jgi:hypothetical protein